MTDSPSPQGPRLTSGRLGVVLGALALTFALGVPSEAAKLINGKNLKNNTVTSQKIKNQNLTGKDVKDDSLQGADIKESSLQGLSRPGDIAAFGNASDTFIDNFTAGAFTPLVSTSFDAPSAGVVHIVGTLSAEDDSTFAGEGRLVYRLRLDADPLTSELFAHELDFPGSARGDSGSATGVVPVTAGTHTVHLEAREISSGSFITGREVSVIFVPSGAGFTRPPGSATTGSSAPGSAGHQPPSRPRPGSRAGRDPRSRRRRAADVVADVVADWQRRHGRPVDLTLTGPAGGHWPAVACWRCPSRSEGVVVQLL